MEKYLQHQIYLIKQEIETERQERRTQNVKLVIGILTSSLIGGILYTVALAIIGTIIIKAIS